MLGKKEELKEEEKACDICGCTDTVVINEKPPWSKTVLIRDRTPEGEKKIFHKTDVMCKDCGLIYKNPMLTKESLTEFYKEDYLKLYEPSNEKSITGQAISYRVLNIIQILDWLKEIDYDVKGKKIVEIGSGFGSLLYALKSMGARVYGIEAGSRPAEISEKLFGITPWITAFDSLSQERLEQHSMYNADLIIISNTLEHFYSPKETLIKARKILSNNGMILIEVPNMFRPYPLINTDGFLSSAHNYTFSMDTIDILFSKCNLMPVHVSEGHKKSILVMLKKINSDDDYFRPIIDFPSYIVRIKSLYKEYDEYFDLVRGGSPQAVHKALDKPGGFDDLLKRFPHFSNITLIIYLDYLLNLGKFKEGLELIKSEAGRYNYGQSEDLHYCEGSYHFLVSLIHRNLGDYEASKKCLELAVKCFPGFNKYNFIKEIHIDGILPETSFNAYTWSMCLKLLKELR